MKPGPQQWRYRVGDDGVERVRCSRCHRWLALDAFVGPTPASKGAPVGNGNCKRCLRIVSNARNKANSLLRQRYEDEWRALYEEQLELSEKREQERDPI